MKTKQLFKDCLYALGFWCAFIVSAFTVLTLME